MSYPEAEVSSALLGVRGLVVSDKLCCGQEYRLTVNANFISEARNFDYLVKFDKSFFIHFVVPSRPG